MLLKDNKSVILISTNENDPDQDMLSAKCSGCGVVQDGSRKCLDLFLWSGHWWNPDEDMLFCSRCVRKMFIGPAIEKLRPMRAEVSGE